VADEVRSTVQGNNGERLEVRIGSKSLGITSRDLLLFAFVAGIFVFIYINSQSNRENLTRIHTQVEQFQDRQHAATTEVKDLLLTAGDQLKDLLRAQQAQRDADMEHIHQWMSVHEYNASREPAERLPIDVPPPAPR
jgi:hypothetical protein